MNGFIYIYLQITFKDPEKSGFFGPKRIAFEAANLMTHLSNVP